MQEFGKQALSQFIDDIEKTDDSIQFLEHLLTNESIKNTMPSDLFARVKSQHQALNSNTPQEDSKNSSKLSKASINKQSKAFVPIRGQQNSMTWNPPTFKLQRGSSAGKSSAQGSKSLSIGSN